MDERSKPRQEPRCVGRSTVDVVLSRDGKAHIDYRTTLSNIPWRGVWLTWEGDQIENLSWKLSTLERPLVRKGKRRVTIVISPSPEGRDIEVQLRYTLRPQAFPPESKAASRLHSNNIPHLNRKPSRLFQIEPDTVVRAHCNSKEIYLFGPEYTILQNEPATPAPALVLGYYTGRTPFSLIWGQFLKDNSAGSVYTVREIKPAISPNFLISASRYGALVRSYLGQLFGNAPVRHRGILVLPVKTPSSIGSGIILRADGDHINDRREQEATLVEDIAHEYVHTWWVYGCLWDDYQASYLINEMLAILLGTDCAAGLGVRNLGETRAEIWAYAAEAVHKGNRSLLKRVSTASGSYAASLLIDVARTNRNAVITAIKDLWRRGQTAVLTRQSFHDVIAAHLGQLAAQSVDEALERPKPVVASIRLSTINSRDWLLSIRTSRRDAAVLKRRLQIVGYSQVTVAGEVLTVRVPSTDDIVSHVYALEPTHLMSRRSVALLAIHRRPLIKRFWNWASCSPHSFLKSVVALILNSDDPTGWQGLARSFSRLSTIANWCLLVAARRAIYYGEDEIRSYLRRRAEVAVNRRP